MVVFAYSIIHSPHPSVNYRYHHHHCDFVGRKYRNRTKLSGGSRNWYMRCRATMISHSVGLPEDVEARSFVPDISGVTIKDEAASDDGDSNPSSGTLWKYKLPSNSISKEAAVGSLSFNVIDTSPRKQSAELPKQVASEDSGKLASSSQQQKTAVRKPAPRAKVPFEKGYSQMDWLKLCRTHPDLAGLNGQSNRRLISLNEVTQHQTGGAMWTVLKGRVYNIAPYMKFHPGGVDMLMKAVGKDSTSLFNKYHAWVNADALLEKCLVGTLDSQ